MSLTSLALKAEQELLFLLQVEILVTVQVGIQSQNLHLEPMSETENSHSAAFVGIHCGKINNPQHFNFLGGKYKAVRCF